ncbi:MAG: DUF751 family protein [Synechococcales bacterium]|nr:DUF751 family protein [Synechococcales bacterium]
MQELLKTISKYPRFLAGVMLGILLYAFSPLVPLFKNPITAIASTGVIVGGLAFLAFTLQAMLGL